MITTADAEHLIGAMALDPANDRIGEIRQVFLDADTDRPTWVGVRVGLMGTEVLVPLDGAAWDDRTLHAAVSRSSARDAPAVDLDEPLTDVEQERLLRHYGIPCVCTPRERFEVLQDDEPLSYSVKDEALLEVR